jgi:hypothetical protein
MTREPVDGVMCVVWTTYAGTATLACRDNGHWFSTSGRNLKDHEVTHWTTLDEAKAAPELLEELTLLRALKACTDLGMGKNLVVVSGPNGGPDATP